MKIKELEQLKNEGAGTLPSEERRRFLGLGLTVTGVFAGGSVLSLTSIQDARGALEGMELKSYPYKPHYGMVIRQDRCIDCERCLDACARTNHVPSYGYRTTILEREILIGPGRKQREFMPVLCNHCNQPPCVRVCPTKATYKDKKTGIVMMTSKKCIGCKTCMAACPYNARYFNEEIRAVDKCNFCFDTRLSKGKTITACAEACPADVRIFGDISDPESRAYEMIHEMTRVVWVLRPETGAAPNIFYTKG